MSEKKKKKTVLRLLDSFAAAEVQLISKNNIPIRISETIQSSHVEGIIHLLDTSHIMLLLYLPLSTNQHSYSLLKISTCSSSLLIIQIPNHPFTQLQKTLQIQCKGDKSNISGTPSSTTSFLSCNDRTRLNHGSARARSTHIRGVSVSLGQVWIC